MNEPTSSRSRPGIDDGWLTIVEAAWRLGLTPRTLERLISSGQLPTTEVDGRRRVAPKDLDPFIDGRRISPGSLAHLHNWSTARRRAERGPEKR